MMTAMRWSVRCFPSRWRCSRLRRRDADFLILVVGGFSARCNSPRSTLGPMPEVKPAQMSRAPRVSAVNQQLATSAGSRRRRYRWETTRSCIMREGADRGRIRAGSLVVGVISGEVDVAISFAVPDAPARKFQGRKAVAIPSQRRRASATKTATEETEDARISGWADTVQNCVMVVTAISALHRRNPASEKWSPINPKGIRR